MKLRCQVGEAHIHLAEPIDLAGNQVVSQHPEDRRLLAVLPQLVRDYVFGHQRVLTLVCHLNVQSVDHDALPFSTSPVDNAIVLALLLENVGADAAVRLADPKIWRSAVSELPA